ncbi:2,5-diketo-D-gluconate reductase A [Arthrobacter stackebrandtii]|uniref:2,5-diketo-D-gluconate reductase A n=1 Tax=Arthrobacter stackebrandtii TaxID=272161 RepID=A0ABS4YST8_9MICC|nr:aldo/keto reductase [Arthrobacter stackebrandtii]MBP2411866.1 2,5-diketo-D-gluconate reductase A [Arthrobacter stackebrandtii]PYG99105.1 2,5-diketo-D-gluconic acid reductase [Arthrobacter stackebrandtii]
MKSIPSITLNNGVAMPQIGFGVFQVPNDETEQAVTAALAAGYRSIDTAAIYGNEEGVGRAIAASGLPREELFITSKVWISDLSRGETLAAYDASLAKLGLDYLDLYLIHWPAPATDAYVAAWQALEELLAAGRVRAIGVSNFLPEHLEKVIALGGTVPAVNQVEVHPALQQRGISGFGAAHGIATEAWSPLAQGTVLSDPAVAAAAAAHGRTPAQVVLRWHLQQGRIIIPKSVTPARMAENVGILDFELSPQELAAIDALECDGRIGPHPADFNG